MEIKLKLANSNQFPLGGIIIKGKNPAQWATEIQFLDLNTEPFEVFPIPDKFSALTWGCLVVLKDFSKIKPIVKHEYCQAIHQRLFIPNFTTLLPTISELEAEQLFGEHRFFFHPEVGLIELKEKINWSKLLIKPEIAIMNVQRPAEPTYIPKRIRSFQVHSLPPEEVLKNFHQNYNPEKLDFKNEKLNLYEQFKFQFYKLFFKNANNTIDSTEVISKPTKFLSQLGLIFNTENNYMERMKKDYDELFRRNQKQFEKLMYLFQKDPLEALKYAIPIDENRMTRGSSAPNEMRLFNIWDSFGLFSNKSKGVGRGGVIDLGDNFYKLKDQYNTTANDLIKKGDYQKAAFIYMKLLKDYHSAALALEKGGFYQEAASIYLKYISDKEKAAICFEKGHYYMQAIELFKELKKFEKVGDIYKLIDKKEQANIFYELSIDNLKSQFQYVKAALIYRNKMNSPCKGQAMLLEGWRQNKDSFNCLNNYFQNFDSSKNLLNEIRNIYRADVNSENRKTFLKIIHLEYLKYPDIKNEIRNVSYEIISLEIKADATNASDLVLFNEGDNELLKDIVRIKQIKYNK